MNILDKIEKLERQAKIISAEIDLLRKQLGKVNFEENEYKRWRAIPKEDYWYIDYIGDINYDYEADEERDDFRYSIGNYFRTEKEAQEYKESLITKQKLKDLALRLNKGIEIDWNDQNQYKFFIVLNHNTESLCSERYVAFQSLNVICCLDKNFLDIAKEEIGEKALIKLIKSGV